MHESMGKDINPNVSSDYLGTEGNLIKHFFFSFFLYSDHILLVSLKNNYKENRSFSLQKKNGTIGKTSPAFDMIESNKCLKEAKLNAQLPSTCQVSVGKSSPHFTLHLLFTEAL